MSDDTLTNVCEDLLQLRDEVAQSEFRPSADTICDRLGVLASRVELLEACYSQPQSGGADGSQGSEAENDAAGPEHEVSGSTHADTPRAEVDDATVHTKRKQGPTTKNVRARKSR